MGDWGGGDVQGSKTGGQRDQSASRGRALPGELCHREREKNLQSFATLKGTNVAGGTEGEGEGRGQAERERAGEGERGGERKPRRKGES